VIVRFVASSKCCFELELTVRSFLLLIVFWSFGSSALGDVLPPRPPSPKPPLSKPPYPDWVWDEKVMEWVPPKTEPPKPDVPPEAIGVALSAVAIALGLMVRRRLECAKREQSEQKQPIRSQLPSVWNAPQFE
jgi:hypothetical protein